MKTFPSPAAAGLAALLLAVPAAPALAKDAPKAAGRPSRKADKGCTWEKLSDASVGLEVWAERCDYGSRKIDFLLEKNALLMRYSDGGKPEPVVEVFDLKDGETPEAGVSRVWAEKTPKFFHDRCLAAPVSYTHLTLPTILRV